MAQEVAASPQEDVNLLPAQPQVEAPAEALEKAAQEKAGGAREKAKTAAAAAAAAAAALAKTEAAAKKVAAAKSKTEADLVAVKRKELAAKMRGSVVRVPASHFPQCTSPLLGFWLGTVQEGANRAEHIYFKIKGDVERHWWFTDQVATWTVEVDAPPPQPKAVRKPKAQVARQEGERRSARGGSA